MGSPVYFPNYKIPFLIQDIGLNVLRNIDVTTLKDQIRPVLPGKRVGAVVGRDAADHRRQQECREVQVRMTAGPE